jgi:hypothetical protein
MNFPLSNNINITIIINLKLHLTLIFYVLNDKWIEYIKYQYKNNKK